tara:strand:+ start:465 stop:1079 length:615 start_codon:yes stop_codon:yes gene_type:complete
MNSSSGNTIIATPIKSSFYYIETENPCSIVKDSIWVKVVDTLTTTFAITYYEDSLADIELFFDDDIFPEPVLWISLDLLTNSGQNIFNVPPGSYQVQVVGQNPCANNLSIDVIPYLEESELIEDECIDEEVIVTPDLSRVDYFSPNGDGVGETIMIHVRNGSIINSEGKILRSVHYKEVWDGTDKYVVLQPAGVYIVILGADVQ